ncbi:MAG: barstar family protein [Gammaproteobacteria bacterium]|nr:barstar family protein [Gammaproteobacteria bacterium]MDD5471586.1 barstar family protein [Sideroxydans sp.]
MSDLCERLQDLAEAGVYRLSCPVEVLRGNVALSELRSFELDLANVHSKGEFLAAVAHAIQAPDWFGHNFDALADALCDLSWLEQIDSGYVLLLLNSGETLGMTAADHAIVTDIFNDAVNCWKTAGKPFWVFLA